MPTLGVRRSAVMRNVLAREAANVETRWGPITGKIAFLPDGSRRFTPEYEDCRRIAVQKGKSLAEIMAAARAAFQTSK